VWESSRWILKAMSLQVRQLQWSVSYNVNLNGKRGTYTCRSFPQARR
jgi:hypothetical protein